MNTPFLITLIVILLALESSKWLQVSEAVRVQQRRQRDVIGAEKEKLLFNFLTVGASSLKCHLFNCVCVCVQGGRWCHDRIIKESGSTIENGFLLFGIVSLI